MRAALHGVAFAQPIQQQTPDFDGLDSAAFLGDFYVRSRTDSQGRAPAQWGAAQVIHESGIVVGLLGRRLMAPHASTGASIVDMAHHIAASYVGCGQELWKQLDGEFALAVWDSRLRQLTLVSDAVSSFSLYFAWSRKGELHFGTHLGHVARRSSRNGELDRDWVVSAITQVPPIPGATCYKMVSVVPSGAAVLFESRTQRALRYWRPRQVGDATPDELVSSFRERLREQLSSLVAAQERVCFSVSGGLDSSSLVCMAALNDADRICAVTHSTPNDPASYELDYARLAAHRAGVELYVEPADKSFAIEQALALAPAPHVAHWSPLLVAVAQRATSLGADCMVTGSFGDIAGGVDYGWRQHRFSEAGRGFRGVLAVGSTLRATQTPLQLAKLYLRFSCLSAAELYDLVLAQSCSSTCEAGLIARSVWHDSALTARLSCRASLWDSPEASLERLLYDCLTWEVPTLQGLARTIEQLTGLPVVMPFCDRGLIGISASLPWELRRGPEGNRVLERRAFAGIVPEEIRLRQTKCHFNTFFSDYYRRSLRGETFIRGGAFIEALLHEPWETLRQRAVVGPFGLLRATFRAGLIGAWLRCHGVPS